MTWASGWLGGCCCKECPRHDRKGQRGRDDVSGRWADGFAGAGRWVIALGGRGGSSGPAHHGEGGLSGCSDIVCTPGWLLPGVGVMARNAALRGWRREVRVGGRRGAPGGGVGVWGRCLGLQAGAPPGTAQRGRGVVYLGLGGLAGRGSQQHAEDQADQSAHTQPQTLSGVLQGIM